MQFQAHSIPGAGRGKDLGTPTVNLELSDVPDGLQEGVYACFVHIESQRSQAVLHFGPRPVFHDAPSCEVHLLDTDLPSPPSQLQVEVISRLRDVQDFPSVVALQEQIADDIAQARSILDNAS